MRIGQGGGAATQACAVLLLGAALAVGVRAQETGATRNDLSSISALALARDPAFSAAQAVRAANAEAPVQAAANLWPNLTASLGDTANRVNFHSGSPQLAPDFQKTFNAWGPSLQLNMPVFNRALWDGLDEAHIALAQDEANLAQSRSDLLLRTAQAYFDLLGAQDALAALRENKRAVSEQLAQAKREFEVGTKTVVDTHEAKARYDQIDAQEQVALGELAVRRSALRAITGDDPGTLRELRDPVLLPPPQPNDVETWSREAERSSPAVAAAQAGMLVASSGLRRARDAYQPTVNLTGSVQYQKQDNGSIYIPVSNALTNTTLGITLSIPVFTGGALQSRVREAHAREDQARAELDRARRNAAHGARQAYAGVDYGLAQVQALESAEVSARTQLESTRLGYQVGMRLNLDVLNANTQLFNTRRDLKRARYDVIVNGLRLKAAAGRLGDEDLAAVNLLLLH
jgi:outer membrane protein